MTFLLYSVSNLFTTGGGGPADGGFRGRVRGRSGLDRDLGATNGRSVDLTLSPPDLPVVSPVSPARRGQSLVVITDAVSLALAFALGSLARQPLGRREGPGPTTSLLHELPYISLYILALAAYGLYRRDGRRLRPSSFLDIGPRGHALALGAILTLAVSDLFTGSRAPKIGWVEVVFMTAPAVVLVPMGRGLVSLALRGHEAQRSRVVIVGSGIVATSLARRMGRFPDIKLLGFVDDDPRQPEAELLSTYLGPSPTSRRSARICRSTGCSWPSPRARPRG